MGKTDWDAAQNDLVVTNVQEIMDAVRAIYRYTIFKDHYKVRRNTIQGMFLAVIYRKYLSVWIKIQRTFVQDLVPDSRYKYKLPALATNTNSQLLIF